MEYNIQAHGDYFIPMYKNEANKWCKFMNANPKYCEWIEFDTLAEADQFLKRKKANEPIYIDWPLTPIDPADVQLSFSSKELICLSDACSCYANFLSHAGDPVDVDTLDLLKTLIPKLDAAQDAP